jgi:eukaryotic-like serine/threonine-protein kinase
LLLLPRCTLAHYEASGVGPGALRVIDEHWSDVEQSRIIMLSETFGAMALSVYASAYIAAAASESGARRQALLRAAEKGARRLYRRTSIFRWRSWVVESSIAVLRGNREKAIGLLLKAETACAAVDLGMMVGPIRRRRGEVIGGEEGRALIESADAELRAEGMVNPERLTAAMVPGIFA